MPFIIPEKLTKISNGTRFSKYKNLDESALFLLQKKKMPFRRDKTPSYRIITQQHPFYELANADELSSLRHKQWEYCVNCLPRLIPSDLSNRGRHLWFIAHFTQLAVEGGAQDDYEEEPHTIIVGSGRVSTPPRVQRRSSIPEGGGSFDTAESEGAGRMRSDSTSMDEDFSFRANDEEMVNRPQTPPTIQLYEKLMNDNYFPRRREISQSIHSGKSGVYFGHHTASRILHKNALVLPLRGGVMAALIVCVSTAFAIVIRDVQLFAFVLLSLLCSVVVLCVTIFGKPVFISIVFTPQDHMFEAQSQSKPAPSAAIKKPSTAYRRKLSHRRIEEREDMQRYNSRERQMRSESSDANGHEIDEATEDEYSGEQSGMDGIDSGSDMVQGLSQDLGPMPPLITPRAPPSITPRTPSSTLEALPALGQRVHAGRFGYKEPGAERGNDSFSLAEHDSFNVRCGPAYKKNKFKAPSERAWFDPVAVDMFATGGQVRHITQYMDFSKLSEKHGAEDAEEAVDSWAVGTVPEFFVIHLAIPDYPPGMPWAIKTDGEGHSLVMTFRLNPEARKRLLDEEQASSGPVALLKNFFSAVKGPDPDNLCARLKCIPKIHNPEELAASLGRTLQTLITSYNAKPFMTGPRCHEFFVASNVVEVCCDMHNFSYLARKGAHGLMDMVPHTVVDLGIVVEAWGDEEQPEQLLGCVTLRHVDLANAPSLQACLAKTTKS